MFNKDVLDYLLSKDDHRVFKTNAARILTNVIETRDSLIDSLSIIVDVVKKADLEDIFEDDSYPYFDPVINMLSEIIGKFAVKKRELDDLLNDDREPKK